MILQRRVLLNFCRNSTGFTLIEVILVMAGLIIMTGMILPVSLRFYRTQALDETSKEFIHVARRAQAQALHAQNDNAFGIQTFSNSYSIFEGDSYALRVGEEVFIVPPNVVVSGLSEIVFEKKSGIPSISGLITFTSANLQTDITIQSQGLISKTP